tara:strand:+ start:13644 stop:13832 length:189 start_codon:yes stop_codon:yes gene_type:complete
MQKTSAQVARDHSIDDLVTPPLPPNGWLSHRRPRPERLEWEIPAALLGAAAVLGGSLLAIAS